MTATDQLAAPTADRSTGSHPGRALGWAFTMTFADRAVWRRLLTMAVGIGICSLALLALVSIPPTLDRMAVTTAALLPINADPGTETFSYHYVSFAAGDETITGALLSGPPQAPPPPGAPRFPQRGEIYASPRLAALLASPEDADVRTLLPGRVIGVLPADRIRGADDLFFYRGADGSLAPNPATGVSMSPASGWGGGASNQGLDPELWILLATGSVLLLVPLLLFVGLASRLGSARRERRNGMLALLGAGRGRIRLLGAVESGAAGLLGVMLGSGALLVLRQFIDHVRFSGVGLRSEDVGPTAASGWWVSIGIVTIAAVTGSFVGYRPADASRPQGSTPLRRRPFRWWWRVLLLVVSAATVWWMLEQSRSDRWDLQSEAARVLAPCITALLVMLTLVAVSTPLVLMFCRLWRPASSAGQLARGRILMDGTLTTRSVAALATVLAGSIALFPLLGDSSADGVNSPMIETFGQVRGSVGEIPAIESAARQSDGLLNIEIGSSIGEDSNPDRHGPGLTVINCSAVEQADPTADCQDGDIFQVPRADPVNDPLPEPPYRIMQPDYGSATAQGSAESWSPPTDTKVLTVARDPNRKVRPSQLLADDYLLTPEAAAREFPKLVTTRFYLTVYMHLRPGMMPRVQLALAPLGDRAFDLFSYTSETQSVTPFRPWIIGALIAVGTLVLLISALAQTLTTLEQIRERRRPYALGRAVGLPLSLLSLSIGLSLVVPILVTMVAAVGAGLLLNLVLGELLQIGNAAIDWPLVGVGVGAALLAAILVALGATWSLQRSTRPAAMRTE